MTFRVIYEEEDDFGDNNVTMSHYQDFESADEVTKFVLGLAVTNWIRQTEGKCADNRVLRVTEVGREMLPDFEPTAVVVEHGVKERKERLRKLAEEEKRKAADDAEVERKLLVERQRAEYARLKAKFEDGKDVCVCHGSTFGVVHLRGVADTHCRDCGCLIERKCSKCHGLGRYRTFHGKVERCSECEGKGEAK